MNKELKYQYARLNIAEKIIAINVLVFIIIGLVDTLFSFQVSSWFHLPANINIFLQQPWSLVTYSFLHGGIFHLLFNMLWLYFGGRTFLNLFDDKRFNNVYFMGVILGAFIFLLCYNVIPNLIATGGYMVGASAGVMAVLIFICAYIPDQEVRIFFFNVKLWHIGLFYVLLDLLQISAGNNIGGSLAHLAGAFWGYYYARKLLYGHDIGEGLTKFQESLASAFNSKEKKAPLKTVYKNSDKKRQSRSSNKTNKDQNQQKIDTILDKISKSGYESLSKEEKDFLFKAGKED